MSTNGKATPVRFGVYFALGYVLVVIGLFLFTWITATPEQMGFEWIPFIWLARPWYDLDGQTVIPGLIANAFLLFALGALSQWLARRVFTRGAPESRP